MERDPSLKHLGRKVIDALRKGDKDRGREQEPPEGTDKLTIRQMIGFVMYRRWYDKAPTPPEDASDDEGNSPPGQS